MSLLLIDNVLEHFDIGKRLLPVETMADGWVNKTSKITSEKGIYILREYLIRGERIPSDENISFELDFMNYLYQHGLPVPKIIQPIDFKDQFEKYSIKCKDNEQYYVLFQYINGIKYVNTVFNPQRQLWQVTTVAHFLGQMHFLTLNTTKDWKTRSEKYRIHQNFAQIKYELLTKFDQFKSEQDEIYRRIEILIEKHTSIIPIIDTKEEQVSYMNQLEENLPKGCIHADFHDDNVLFNDKEKTLSTVLDFDEMYYGPFLIDISYVIICWCFIGDYFNEEYFKSFLIEYQNSRQLKLIEEEWNLLFSYCYLTILNDIYSKVKTYNSDPIIQIKNIQMIKILLAPIEYLTKINEKQFIQRFQIE